MRFDIRRKEFPYSDAPELDGVTAGYEATIRRHDGSGMKVVSRHGNALDAAIAAAEECHRVNQTDSGWYAGVQGFWQGERPAGVMKHMMHVSYRVRD